MLRNDVGRWGFPPSTARSVLLLAILLTAAGARPVEGTRPQDGTIAGVVVDEGNTGLANVELHLLGEARNTSSGVDGTFEFGGLPPGEYIVAARRGGFRPTERTVALAAGERMRIVLTLARLPTSLPPLVVLGSPAERDKLRREAGRTPGMAVHLDPADLSSTRRANLVDALRLVPGVYIQPKFGAADKAQLSIRGSGLRSAFELQGVNLVVNGSPYRHADGFADLESLELLTVDNLQVYHAGNAFRYGGSTVGGAIHLQTKTGHTTEPIEAVLQGGSFGFGKGQVASGGVHGEWDHYVSYARTELDGYRVRTGNERDRVTAHLGWEPAPDLTLRTLYTFAAVREERPGALTREEFEADPRQANPSALVFNSGRAYDQHHLGLRVRGRPGGPGILDVTPYVQFRSQEIRTFRIIDQQLTDYGVNASYELTNSDSQSPYLRVGFQAALGSVDNRYYRNSDGVKGELTKDQKENAAAVGGYLERRLGITDRLSGMLGLRYDWHYRAVNDFVVEDGDQSDEKWMSAALPRVGLLYDLPSLDGNLHFNVTRLFSPPMLIELNSLLVQGFVDVQPQKAWQIEVGVRGRRGPTGWSLAAYDIELTDEILNVNVQPFPDAPFTAPSHRNADRTRHYGLEVGFDHSLPLGSNRKHALVGRMMYTFSRYRFVEDSTFDGNQIPGVPTHVARAEIAYESATGLAVSGNLEWVPDDYFVNSENTERNAGWTVLGAKIRWRVPSTDLRVSLEAFNLTDERYAPAVNADNALGRYFLPATGRSLTGSLEWRL